MSKPVEKGAVGLKVYCPGCKKSFHETTEHFDPEKPARGDMVRLVDPYRKWGWCSFGDQGNGLSPDRAERKGTYYSEMDCPGCGAAMAPHRFLYIKHADGLIHTGKLMSVLEAAGELPVVEEQTDAEGAIEAVKDSNDVADADEPRHVKVIRLRDEGLSYKKIADAIGNISKDTVRKIIKNHEKQEAAA